MTHILKTKPYNNNNNNNNLNSYKLNPDKHYSNLELHYDIIVSTDDDDAHILIEHTHTHIHTSENVTNM